MPPDRSHNVVQAAVQQVPGSAGDAVSAQTAAVERMQRIIEELKAENKALQTKLDEQQVRAAYSSPPCCRR